jgi:hypothetical protein
LIVVELKQGSYKPEYKDQIELYLRGLEKNDTQEGANPFGIVLCAGTPPYQTNRLGVCYSAGYVSGRKAGRDVFSAQGNVCDSPSSMSVGRSCTEQKHTA